MLAPRPYGQLSLRSFRTVFGTVGPGGQPTPEEPTSNAFQPFALEYFATAYAFWKVVRYFGFAFRFALA
jgi:hypothetical protein